ncbi:MAG TPA: DUF1080 domain-containing protein, partial [Caulobacterales bacterium]|nr:DUF1080 domain-containing protein [Caulobacterales bacterium]
MRGSVIAALLLLSACCTAKHTETAPMAASGMNTLSAAEQSAGWRLLFDGRTTAGWRDFKSDHINPQWQVVDGALTLTAPGGGDIVSVDEYENFELMLDWKISPGGNSGIFFNVVEGDHDTIWRTGPEMQILDNEAAEDRVNPTHRAGSNYDLEAPRVVSVHPANEWNSVRLVVNHGHVQQFLNGELQVEYDLWSPAWEAQVARSKFASMPDYGRAHRGHLALQDHGNVVAFR